MEIKNCKTAAVIFSQVYFRFVQITNVTFNAQIYWGGGFGLAIDKNVRITVYYFS